MSTYPVFIRKKFLPFSMLDSRSLIIVAVLLSCSYFFTYSFAESNTTIQTDKTMYFTRDTIILDGTVDHLDGALDNVKIEFINPNGKIINEQNIKLDRERLTFRTNISLIESYWNVEGLYRIKATYGDQATTGYFHFFQSNSGIPQVIKSTIGLDKKSYTWTDTVEIYAIAPAFNKNNNIEYIGLGLDSGTVEIKTGKGKLTNYKLIETAGNSGIFHGTVILTGDSSIDADGNGYAYEASEETYGTGAFDGKIPAGQRDIIKVTFTNNQESISDQSQILWNKGQIIWQASTVEPRSEVTIQVRDPDMNIVQDRRDSFNVLVWSDSDKTAKKIGLMERGVNSGIFEGVVLLSDQSSGSKIRTSDGDKLYVRYEDRTVSDQTSAVQKIESNIPVRSQQSSQSNISPKTGTDLEKPASGYEPSVKNEFFDSLVVDAPTYQISSGKATLVKIDGTVKQSDKGSVIYIMIQNPNGENQELKVPVSNAKKFSTFLNIDSNSPAGKYLVTATYKGEGKTVSFELVKKTESIYQTQQQSAKPVPIPTWIKTNAGWWADGQISDDDFVKGLQFMIKQKIIKISANRNVYTASDVIPTWIKTNAGWWADGQISDDDFVKGLQFMVENGIIKP